MTSGRLTLPMLSAPTAAGKTALALRLAGLERTGGSGVEIVSADAFLVYRGLDIGTAKPSLQERTGVPHHLIDVAEVHELYDVARYVREAEAAIGEVLARGQVPLVVGGSGFYLSALSQGLPLTPPSQPAQREAVEAELRERGLDALLAEVAAFRPAEAARMQRNPRRVVRALEVYRQSGRWPGDFGTRPPLFSFELVAFTPPRDELERRMRERVAAMFAAGWAEEAAWLARQVDPATRPRPTVWQALGYREALGLWRGELSPQEAHAQVKKATAAYARRQLTFLRGPLRAELLSPEAAEAQLGEALRRMTFPATGCSSATPW